MDSKLHTKIQRLTPRWKNEKGIVIVSALAITAMLALISTAIIISTTTEVNISSNYETNAQAFYNTESGLEEARARLRGLSTDTYFAGDQSFPHDPSWLAYLTTSSSWDPSDDPYYDDVNYTCYFPTTSNKTNTSIVANSFCTATSTSYWVKIRHKRESDLLPGEPYTDNTATSDDIIYYGYATSTSTVLEQYTTNNPKKSLASPVEIIESYGSFKKGDKIIETQVRKSVRPPVVAAVYGDVVDGNGNVTVVGNDNCSSDPIPCLGYVTADNLSDNGSVLLTSDAGESIQLSEPIDVAKRVEDLRLQATQVLTADQTGYSVGDSSNYEIVYCDATALAPDGELDLKTDSADGGYGTLVVKGDCEFGGNIVWHGLIVVSGNITFSGGGTKAIYGAVIADSAAAMDGTPYIYYDSCEIEKANSSYRYHVARWKDPNIN